MIALARTGRVYRVAAVGTVQVQQLPAGAFEIVGQFGVREIAVEREGAQAA